MTILANHVTADVKLESSDVYISFKYVTIATNENLFLIKLNLVKILV